MALLLMSVSVEGIAPVISLRDPKVTWNKMSCMYKTTSAASVDWLVVKYQSLRMDHSEKGMWYSSLLKKIENKLMVIEHVVGQAEQKLVLLHGVREEIAVMARVNGEKRKSIHEVIGMLVLREAKFGAIDQAEISRIDQAFTVRKFS